MKKIIALSVVVAGIAAGATLSCAATGSQGGGIVGSKHDMNVFVAANGGVKDTDQRVCAYCHTPHHAADPTQKATTLVGSTTVEYDVYLPLWSRAVPAGGYAQYKSATFDPKSENKFYDAMAGPSRLCMSCHDGVIAADSYYGKTNNTTSVGDDQINYFGSGHFAIGQSNGLANDHPVGMEYDAMVANTNYELKAKTSAFIGGTKTIAATLTTIDNKGIMTCASCHDVHNGPDVKNTAPASGRGYFLLASQVDSAICLSCHDKNK